MDRSIQLIREAHTGDEAAREQLVKENVGLIWCVVKGFTGRGVEAEDLYQIGSIGLLKAIDRFDFSYDVKFSTYAIPMITGEIKRFLRDDGMIKVSRSLKSISYKAYMVRERFIKELGREPGIEEIAKTLEITPEELTAALDSGGEVESLNRPIYQHDGNETQLMDKIEETSQSEEEILNKILIQQLLQELKAEERKLIYLRYYANLTQSQVGKRMGISQVQVSRMEKKILSLMRERV